MQLKTFVRCSILLMLMFSFQELPSVQIGRKAVGEKGVVVAGKPQAVEAGVHILENGGNAADAATAALLMLAVKHVGAFCMGGEVPVIIHNAATHEVKVGPSSASTSTATPIPN